MGLVLEIVENLLDFCIFQFQVSPRGLPNTDSSFGYAFWVMEAAAEKYQELVGFNAVIDWEPMPDIEALLATAHSWLVSESYSMTLQHWLIVRVLPGYCRSF